jgi:hypothetical protein
MAVVVCASSFQVGTYWGVHREEFDRAKRCASIVANSEAAILGPRGEGYVVRVILNRAGRLDPKDSFLERVCRAAFDFHWNPHLRKLYPDMSGALVYARRGWIDKDDKIPGIERTRRVAVWEVGHYVLGYYVPLYEWLRDSLVRRDHTHFHSFTDPAKARAWAEQNKVVCNEDYQQKIFFCEPRQPAAEIILRRR